MSKKQKMTMGGNFPLAGQKSKIITLTQPQRFRIDIATYMTAIRSFENVDFTQRAKLYDIYSDIVLDPHLSSVLEKRRNAVLSAPVEFVVDGKPDDTIMEQLKSPWFSSFLMDALDAKFFGITLFQFEKGKDGYISYEIVPRKHFDPIRRIIKARQTDLTGLPYDDFYNLLSVGNPRDLGLLANVAPYVIYKRATMGDWSQFSELFGMPIREYTYDAADDDARNKIMNDAFEQGGAGVYIHPEGTNFALVESGNKTGSADLYDRLTERCNNEISKQILGNTLTTEAGDNGTQALGTVQAKAEDVILMSDRRYLLNLLNYDFTDVLDSLGIDTSRGEFRFAESDNLDKEKQLRIYQGLAALGLEISKDELYETFGVERPGKKDEKAGQQATKTDGSAEEEEDKKKKPIPPSQETKDKEVKEDSFWSTFWNRALSFFRQAPQDGAE